MVPNIESYIAVSALQGMSAGMIFVPAISIVSFYFDKWRSVATTITNCGISVASIAFPPLVRGMAEQYGIRGTFLIASGLQFHMMVAGLLLRPVSSYKPRKKPDPTPIIEEDETTEMFLPPSSTDDKSVSHQNDSQENHNKTGRNGVMTSHRGEDTPLPAVLEKDITGNINGKDGISAFSYQEKSMHLINGSEKETEILSNSPKLLSFSRLDKANSTEDVNSVRERVSSFSQKRPISPLLIRQDSAPAYMITKPRSNSSAKGSLTGSMQLGGIPYGSVWSVTSGIEAVGVAAGVPEETEAEEEEEPGGWRAWCFCRIVRNIFDPALFRLWSVRVFLLSAILGATNQYLLTYIPTIAVIQGASKNEGALLLVIAGSVDLASRFVVGFIADLRWLRASRIVAIGQICLGLCCHIGRLCRSFDTLLGWTVFLGMFIGIRMSLMPLVLIEMVGISQMAKAFSLVAFVGTISAATHSPLLSALMEATGNFNMVLHYCGVALMVTGFVFAFIPNLVALDNRREQKRQQQTEQLTSNA
ncbi:uncharacterized protein LOC101852833 [Aplysia californica]|uniref:Uncharacterized protein LOC101852833 n=1 Tax=Aplysia californica TaxID=6500 RepID=A0ABM0ZV89_APLCA|nr:uncharacterized protein LOC101852833 [Aplysia californica]